MGNPYEGLNSFLAILDNVQRTVKANPRIFKEEMEPNEFANDFEVYVAMDAIDTLLRIYSDENAG